MAIKLYKGDLPAGLDFGSSVAIDTETLGLDPRRDKLCLVQLSSGDGNAHLVQLDRVDLRRAAPQGAADQSGRHQDLPLRPFRRGGAEALSRRRRRPRSTAPRSPPS